MGQFFWVLNQCLSDTIKFITDYEVYAVSFFEDEQHAWGMRCSLGRGDKVTLKLESEEKIEEKL